MKKLWWIASAIILVGVILLNACSASGPAPSPAAPSAGESYKEPTVPATSAAPRPTSAPSATARPTVTASPYPSNQSAAPYSGYPPAPSSGNIGLAAGGAKDIANFRENIRNNYLPLPTDVTYEGLFYDYIFDTGMRGSTNKLYCPSYAYAVTRDPLSGQPEYYMAVGLNSGMKESDF
jgi:hypothetical protein